MMRMEINVDCYNGFPCLWQFATATVLFRKVASASFAMLSGQRILLQAMPLLEQPHPNIWPEYLGFTSTWDKPQEILGWAV